MMTPLKVDLLHRKFAIIQNEIKLLAQLSKTHIDARADPIVKHALCHSMQVAICAVIDVAQHICAERGEPIESYTDAIERLGSLKALDKKFAGEFSRVAKLRNVLVHVYDSVDHAFLASLLPRLIKDLKQFIRSVEGWIEG